MNFSIFHNLLLTSRMSAAVEAALWEDYNKQFLEIHMVGRAKTAQENCITYHFKHNHSNKNYSQISFDAIFMLLKLLFTGLTISTISLLIELNIKHNTILKVKRFLIG